MTTLSLTSLLVLLSLFLRAGLATQIPTLPAVSARKKVLLLFPYQSDLPQTALAARTL